MALFAPFIAIPCYWIVVFRSPQAYSDLQASGALTLPFKHLLQYYKNSVDQAPGINTRQLEWMQKEAISKKVSEFGKRGGLVIDEMSIQDDIQVKNGLYFSFIFRLWHLCMLPDVHSRLKLVIKYRLSKKLSMFGGYRSFTDGHVTCRPCGSGARWSECSHGLRVGRAMCFILHCDNWWLVWVRARAASSKGIISSVPAWFRADSGTNLIKQREIAAGRPCGSVGQWPYRVQVSFKLKCKNSSNSYTNCLEYTGNFVLSDLSTLQFTSLQY